MAKLVERIGYDGRIQHVKDESFFGWRFQNPFSCYHFVFWDDPQLEGYLAFQTPNGAHGSKMSFNVVDWEATHPEVLSGLLQAVIHWRAASNLTLWSTGLSDEKMAVLRRQGFGAAITLAALQHARALGHRWTWIWASSLGRSVYEKLGFVMADFGVREYQWKKRP